MPTNGEILDEIKSKAKASDVYTKTQVDDALGGKLGINDTAQNSLKLGGFPLTSTSHYHKEIKNCIPLIKGDSVMEVGKYMDFHDVNKNEVSDADVRIEVSAMLNDVGNPIDYKGVMNFQASSLRLNGNNIATTAWVRNNFYQHTISNGATIHTTDWVCIGTSITIPSGYKAIIQCTRDWYSGKPMGVALLNKSTDFALRDAIAINDIDIGGYDTNILNVVAIVDVGTYYVWSRTNNSAESYAFEEIRAFVFKE